MINMIKEAALYSSSKGINYVGWDVAITDTGFELIEGNHDPGHSSIQMITGEGYYLELKKILKENSEIKKYDNV